MNRVQVTEQTFPVHIPLPHPTYIKVHTAKTWNVCVSVGVSVSGDGERQDYFNEGQAVSALTGILILLAIRQT